MGAQHRLLDDQENRPVATKVSRNSGARAKGAASDTVGVSEGQTYLSRGARCAIPSGIWQEWGLYGGYIGEVVDVA